MKTDDPTSLTCSTRDAARRLGISVRTAQLWVEEGRLRAWKTPGGHRRILRESVERLVEEQRLAAFGPGGRFRILVLREDEALARTHATRHPLVTRSPRSGPWTGSGLFSGHAKSLSLRRPSGRPVLVGFDQAGHVGTRPGLFEVQAPRRWRSPGSGAGGV